MPDPYPVHGRRWRWRVPWQWSCRCGMDAYPCIVMRTLVALRKDAPRHSAETYTQGLRAVHEWRDAERRRWSGRA